MPYTADPYRGDKYLYEGITGFGDEIEKAFERYNANKQELEKADAAMTDLSQRIDPVTGEPMLPQETIDYWRQSKRRASAYAGIKEAIGLAKSFSDLQAGNEERARDAAAFEQPVASYTDAQGVKHYVGRHTRGSSVTDLDVRGSPGRTVTPNVMVQQYDKMDKMLTNQLKNWPMTVGLGDNPEALLDENNPFGVENSKAPGGFEATPKGSKQTHVKVGDNVLPIDEYRALQEKAKRILDLRQKKDALLQSGLGTGAAGAQAPLRRQPLTPGIPVMRSPSEARTKLPPSTPNRIVRYQTPDGQVYRMPMAGQAAPASTGAQTISGGQVTDEQGNLLPPEQQGE